MDGTHDHSQEQSMSLLTDSRAIRSRRRRVEPLLRCVFLGQTVGRPLLGSQSRQSFGCLLAWSIARTAGEAQFRNAYQMRFVMSGLVLRSVGDRTIIVMCGLFANQCRFIWKLQFYLLLHMGTQSHLHQWNGTFNSFFFLTLLFLLLTSAASHAHFLSFSFPLLHVLRRLSC